jgi:hypothetical protein
MSSVQIVRSSAFDASKVTFTDPKTLNNGGKMVQVGYNSRRLIIQTPNMVLPYGISEFEDPNSGIKKFHIDLSFRGEDETPALKKFHDSLEALDEYMVDMAVENSQLWFKKKMPRAVLSEFYTPVLKKSKDKETGEPNGLYPDTMKVKLRYDNETEEFKCALFDSQTKELIETPPDVLLTKGTRMTAMIACNGVWFAGGRFGLSWRLEQGRVTVNQTKLEGYCFVDDEDEVEESAPAVGGGNDVMLSDGEDGDDDEEEAVEEAPKPEPEKKVRRRVRKKASA